VFSSFLNNDIPVLPNKFRPKLIFGEQEDDSKIRRENAVRNFEVEIKLLKNKAISYELKFSKYVSAIIYLFISFKPGLFTFPDFNRF
jgi:hypothetical protein